MMMEQVEEGGRNKSINMDQVNSITFNDEVNNNANVSPQTSAENKKICVESSVTDGHHPTSYMETMMHLFKGNVGPGCFAMADAVKNGGLVLAPVLTLFLGIVCVHAQHILLNCSEKMRERYKLPAKPDYAETVELCFASSNKQRWQSLAPSMRRTCNVFICITQLGFCCIYFLFIATNLKQVLDVYGFSIEIRSLITLILLPIGLSAMITNLKLLAPCSGIANVCMITGLLLSFYYSAQELPDMNERNFVPLQIHRLPLFFGTAIFAFEGIALVLPLQNAMKEPHKFSKITGVLNIGMTVVTLIFISFGMIGYWKYGEETEGSLTLNLPKHEILAQMVKMAIALGVLLGYAIQFFIPIQIMYPCVRKYLPIAEKYPILGELLFRASMVLITFAVAQLVPNLSALLSLIGAVCSTVLALVLPPLMELIIMDLSSDSTDNNNKVNFNHNNNNKKKKTNFYIYIKNAVILLLSLLGFITGGYESLCGIIKSFNNV